MAACRARSSGEVGNRLSAHQSYQQEMIVQTGMGLRRSHLRKAMSLASMMFQLRPTVVPPTPPARQTQAEASDAPNDSRAVATANVARVVLIIPRSSLPLQTQTTTVVVSQISL